MKKVSDRKIHNEEDQSIKRMIEGRRELAFAPA